MSFVIDRQSMYFISIVSLKGKNNEVHVLQFQLAYICDTTHSSHKNLVELCSEVHYMWWGNQYLYLQEWGYCINSNKTIILDIIVLVPKNNPQG